MIERAQVVQYTFIIQQRQFFRNTTSGSLSLQDKLDTHNAKYASNVIQNDLLHAASDVTITKDIQNAEVFSIIVNETRGICNFPFAVIMLILTTV